ncbi:MAG: cell division protein ZipA, partial [Glaciecola sp.]
DVIRKEPALHASDKLNEEQMRIDFSNEAPSEYGEPSANKEPSQAALTTTQQSASTQSNSASTKASSAQPSEQPTDVLVINIRAPEDREISGAALLPMLLTLGLKFGEQDIFHRHVNTNGKGPVLFSLANLFKPGVFDIDNIETFSTRGLSLFMMLPIEGDAQQVFNMMHNAARKLAEEFSCQILDGGRGLLTKQGLQKYSERIREFERKRINR